MKTITIILIGLIFSVTLMSAMTIDYYYSPNCSHCQKVTPLINSLVGKYNNYNWNFYDVSQGSYNIQGTPTVRIKTNDCREIKLVGSYEIPRWLNCELQQMTTKECPTSTKLNLETNSWFIR